MVSIDVTSTVDSHYYLDLFYYIISSITLETQSSMTFLIKPP